MDKNLAHETLKSFIENTNNVIVKDAILVLHPELNESEDESENEKIRKELISYLTDIVDNISSEEVIPHDAKILGGKIRHWIAYLEKQKDERELVFIEGKMEGVRQTCQEIKDAMSLFEPKDLTPFEFTFRDYIDSAIRYCLSGEGYQQYIKEWAADLLNLEKQEEQKPLMCDGEIEDRKRDIVAAIRKYYPADYAEYLTSFLKGLSPEDNSEDEYGQEMLGIAYKLMYEHIPENLRTKEFWDSLKFMREYTGRVAIIHSYEKPAEQLSGIFTSYDMAKTFTEGQNYVIAHPEKFGLCKPAEWNKEDERNLYNIIEAIKYSYDVSEGSGGLRLINWLKYHLRYQPHWKPSKKQIWALEWNINNTPTGAWQRKELESLYKELLKL